MDELLNYSIEKLDKWVEKNDWKAYDPFDGLNSKLSFLTFNNKYLSIALQQSIRRFPINLRPFAGVKKEASSKGMGFFAAGYLKLYKLFEKKEYLGKALFCLDWLIKNYSNGYSGHCWGNHFNYWARGGNIPKGVPTVVWTSFIANAFLDAYELLQEKQYLDIAKSSCNFVLKDLSRFRDENSICFSYTPLDKGKPVGEKIHNANMLAACLLARVYRHTNNASLLELARKAVMFTIKHQREDGSWFYGEGSKWGWTDNFHTGYVLDSLYKYICYTEDEEFLENLKKGYQFYKNNFFLEDSTPKYYHDKVYPIDIQCGSQSIETLSLLSKADPDCLKLAKKVAFWIIKNMQDKSGYFYFRKYKRFINRTPTLHWGQATMLSALASLLLLEVKK